MNDLQIFKNEAFGQIRVIDRDGEPWFIGKDIAEALGYSIPKDALRVHVDEEDKVLLRGGESPLLNINNRGMTIINESGLYSLVMSSRLPSAKQFKRWVTSEVLPSIRKTGSYSVEQRVPKTFYEALLLAAEQQKLLEEAKPKVDFVDTYVDKGVTICLMDLGKKLGKRPRKFIELLQDEGYLMRHRNNMPYQEYINRGLFEVRTVTEKGLSQTVVTPKGVTYFAEKYRDVRV